MIFTIKLKSPPRIPRHDGKAKIFFFSLVTNLFPFYYFKISCLLCFVLRCVVFYDPQQVEVHFWTIELLGFLYQTQCVFYVSLQVPNQTNANLPNSIAFCQSRNDILQSNKETFGQDFQWQIWSHCYYSNYPLTVNYSVPKFRVKKKLLELSS